jgi:hypothetical protein
MKVLPSASTFIGCACYSKNIMFVFKITMEKVIDFKLPERQKCGLQNNIKMYELRIVYKFTEKDSKENRIQ